MNLPKSCKIEPLVKNILLELINFYIPNKTTTKGRPVKCSNEKYIDLIFYVLRIGVCWAHINDVVSGDAIRKKFSYWTELGLFEKAWKITVYVYNQLKCNFDDLFIDASHIKNIFGTEMIGANHYDRSRNGTKLSVICDDKRIPISMSFSASNIHDIKMLESLLNDIPLDVSNIYNLITDRGYISEPISRSVYEKFRINVITQKKRNMDSNTKEEKAKMKKRHIVENCFCWIKKYRRLLVRYDRQIRHFYSFLFLAACNLTSIKIN